MHNRYMLVLFPICYDKWNYINKIIEQSEIVIDKKKVKLTEIKKFELIYDLYKGESWLGNIYNNWEGVYYKMTSCFTNDSNTVIFYYILSDEIKEKYFK